MQKNLIDFSLSEFYQKDKLLVDYKPIKASAAENCMVFRIGWYLLNKIQNDSRYAEISLDCQYNRNFEHTNIVLDCKLISYDEETFRMVGEIVNVCTDENSKIDLNKYSPITYDPVHHTYRKIGDVVGKAFCDGKKIK